MTTLIIGLILFLGVHSARIFRRRLAHEHGQSTGQQAGSALIRSRRCWAWSCSSTATGWHANRRYCCGRRRSGQIYRHCFDRTRVHSAGGAFVPGNRIKAAVGHRWCWGSRLAAAHLIANGRSPRLSCSARFCSGRCSVFQPRDGAIVRPEPSTSRAQSRTVVAIVAGMSLAVFAFWLHGPLIGVRPLG